MIKITNLSKSFGNFTAVDNINFEINKGEIVGLLGPNGAGKTTTMRMIAGFLDPDEGKIEIEGKTFAEEEFKLKQTIGYMPENNPLYNDMLVSEALNLMLDLNHVDSKLHKERIDKIVKSVGLTDVYYRPIAELSKGYKQRVGIASALISEPEILILDEPTEGLDPNQRNEIRNLLKNIGKERTVIISTHVMQEVEAMCNRIIIINKGKIVADGKPNEIESLSKSAAIIKAELKGKNIIDEIKKIKLVKNVSELGGDAYNIELDTINDEFFKQFSTKVAQNNWTIYRLEPKQNNLESVFQELTQS